MLHKIKQTADIFIFFSSFFIFAGLVINAKKNNLRILMDQVKKHFLAKYSQTGVALTGTQLVAYVKEKKIKGIKPKEIWRFLREEIPQISKFARADKTKHYQTIGVIRPGIYFVDYGEYMKSWSRFNSGATGFLVAVENLTNRLFAIPTQGKDTNQWLNSINQFVELTRDVKVIYSDRDSVAQSAKFRETLVKRFGLEWYFLRKGHKAYLAERYIGYIKTKLSQALLSQESESSRLKNKNHPKHWITFLSAICEEYNAEKIAGTSYRRRTIHTNNFNHFLTQMLKSDQPELLFNSFKAGPFKNPKWNRAIFKFNLGEKVLLARKANWKEGTEKLGVFDKVTTKGGFGNKIYTIEGRQLRADKSFKLYVPVYSLKEMSPSLHFYTNELTKIKYNDRPFLKPGAHDDENVDGRADTSSEEYNGSKINSKRTRRHHR